MVKKLAERGLAAHVPYKGVELTEAGERVALEVLRHHRLLELYLSEHLGVPWDRVHDEAEALEHVISEDLEARIAAKLGHPTHDPHGDPIPSAELVIDEGETQALEALPVGAQGHFVRVSDADPTMLRWLHEQGIELGAALEVVDRQPFEGPLTIRIRDRDHVLGGRVARAMRVELDVAAVLSWARWAGSPSLRSPPPCCSRAAAAPTRQGPGVAGPRRRRGPREGARRAGGDAPPTSPPSRAARCSRWPTPPARPAPSSGWRPPSSRSARTASRSGSSTTAPASCTARPRSTWRAGRARRRRAPTPRPPTCWSRGSLPLQAGRDGGGPVRRRLRRPGAVQAPGDYSILAVTKDGAKTLAAPGQIKVVTKGQDRIPEVGEPRAEGADGHEGLRARRPLDDRHAHAALGHARALVRRRGRQEAGGAAVRHAAAVPVAGLRPGGRRRARAEVALRRPRRVHPPGGLRGQRPEQGPARAAARFNLATEPWLFVVGRDGRITARLEGSFGLRAFEQALKTAL